MFDAGDLIIRDNRVYMPNGTLTAQMFREFSDEVLPGVIEDNEITDSTGSTPLFSQSLGNVSGAVSGAATRRR